MKNNSISLLLITVSLLTTPVVSSATESIETTINATAPTGHHFQGHNQYSSLVTFNGNIYVFSMDELRVPYINKIDETDPNSIETGRLDPINGAGLYDGTYHVYDNGHHRFSIGVDEEGYIHVFGDMHHGNLRTDKDDGDIYNPLPTRFFGSIGNQMYWISEFPEDVSSFSFVGKDSDKALPCEGLTYEHIETDNFGKMYIVSRQSVRVPRIHVPGTMGLGLWRYDITTKKWEDLGEIPSGGYGFDGTETNVMPSIMWEPHGFGERDEIWYQNYASSMKFDVYNRLHLLCAINADSEFNGATQVVYAYSEDGGITWERRDHSEIESLPIRITGPAENRGSILMTQGSEDDFNTSYMGLFWDTNFTPAFSYRPLYTTPSYYCYYDPVAQQSSARNSFDITTVWLRTDHYALNDGSMAFIGRGSISHHQSFTDAGVEYESTDPNIPGWDWEGNKYFMREVDDKLLRDRNILRGLSIKNGEAIVISIDLDPVSTPIIGYDHWARGHWESIGTSEEDYDGDGRNNLYEYALNGDPVDPLSKGVDLTFTNGLLSHLRRNDDVNLIYDIETTTNLTESWTSEEFTSETIETTLREYDESRYTIPTELPQNFLRLKITNP